MMYLSREELVRNIYDQTERAAAVIVHIDPDKFDPNTVIIPFLSNIFDSAMIVTALEINKDPQADCHRNAPAIVMASSEISREIKRFISDITRFREKYSVKTEVLSFDAGDCLDLLNAYDCFMFNFIKTSRTVREMNDSGVINFKFSSFRNMMEKILKKNVKNKNETVKHGDSADEIIRLLNENNRLLQKILDKLCEGESP